MTTSCVYALRDPRTDEIHYVGQSNDPDFRLKQHLADVSDSPKVQWLNGLSKVGLEPRLEILESGLTALEANESENWWISKGIEEGWPLTNQINGEPRESNDFSSWLAGEIESHGYTLRELDRLSETSHATISRVLSGARNPGSDFCTAIATAFHLPPELVFRKAGLLPSQPQGEDRLAKLNTIYHALTSADRATLLRVAEGLAGGGEQTD